MKIIMFSDGPASGTEENPALREVKKFFEDRKYDVDLVQVHAGVSADEMREAIDMVGENDLVVFGNAGRALRNAIERMLETPSEEDLRERNDSLQASNDTLTADNAALQGRNDTLTANNAALQGRNDTLQANNDSLQAHNDILQASNDTLTADNAALQGRNNTLQAHNDILQASNDTLTADNAALQGRNDTLTADNAALQGRNDTLTRDNAALQADNLALFNDSREDSLTKVLNRRGYDQDSRKFVEENSAFIQISVDLNDFKLFNDIYGHNIGDQVLKALANEFRTLVPENGLIARSGGDEFQLLIARPNAAFMQRASEFFNGVHSIEYEGQKYTYSLAAGFAAWPEQTTSFPDLCRMSDSALYHAKMLSKEKFWKYESDMDNDQRVSLGFNARNLAESAPGAMLICKADGKGEILFANPLCAKLFGYDSVREFTNAVKYLIPTIDPVDADEINAYLKEMSGDVDDVLRWEKCLSFRIIMKDGTSRRVKSVGRIITNAHFGKVLYTFMFDCDVAE